MRRPIVILVLALLGCGPADPALHASGIQPETMQETVQTGAAILAAGGFEALRGRRVGLIANHTSLAGDRHLADLLHEAPDVDLVALFGPEHGIRGDHDDGSAIGDTVDARTGVPVYSLYGTRRRPPAGVLDSLDVLIFDIQDVGARFYTFISTMGHAMSAAAEAGVPFVVLDRPNPLGGVRVDGYVLEAGRESFVGLFPIPVQHGLTVGELARMIVGERWLPHVENLDLTVVAMTGWTRSTLWPKTGFPWVPTSPNMPDFETALLYPGQCFFEGTTASEGRGTDHPFLLVGAPWLDAGAAAARLNAADLAGVTFEAIRFKPVSMPGKSTRPRFMDTEIPGIRLRVTQPDSVRALAVGLHTLRVFADDPAAPADFIRVAGMDRLAGTDRLAKAIHAGQAPSDIMASWSDEVEAFRTRREPYLLYR